MFASACSSLISGKVTNGPRPWDRATLGGTAPFGVLIFVAFALTDFELLRREPPATPWTLMPNAIPGGCAWALLDEVIQEWCGNVLELDITPRDLGILSKTRIEEFIPPCCKSW